MSSAAQLIYQTIQNSTASGRGTSYYAVAANCGMKRHLSDLHRELVQLGETNVEAKRKGTLYHGLKDMWLKGEVPEGIVLDVGPIQDQEWAEALRLFNFAREHFPKNYWGDFLASEFKMPINDDHKARIAEFFGHDEVTGAADAVFLLSAEDVARLEADRGVTLRGPGIYLLDHKTAAARKSPEAAEHQYLDSIQAKLYPLLFNLAGGEQCKGIIFDVIVAHQELRRTDISKQKLSSVQTFFAAHDVENDYRARTAVNFARESRNSRQLNPYACSDAYGKCIFKTQNICKGY